MNEDKREFKGVWFPREVWLDSRLTAIEKIILIEIDSLDGDDGCYASNEYLAEFCQCSITKVSNAIAKLKNLGYVSVASFDGRKRVMHSCLKVTVGQTYKNCKADEQNLQERILVDSTSKESKKERSEPKPTTYDEIIAGYTANGDLRQAILEFIKMRKLNKSLMTDRALMMLLKKLDGLASNDAEKIELLDLAIMNSWKSVYKPNDQRKEVRHHDSNACGDGSLDALEKAGYFNFRTDVDL